MSRNAPTLDSLIISILLTRLGLQAKTNHYVKFKHNISMTTHAQSIT
jgi:hypothetical protein